MPEFGKIRGFLEQRFDSLVQMVADPDQLRREFDSLQRYWEQEDDQELMLEQTLQVLHKYPPVWGALQAEGLLEKEETGQGAVLASGVPPVQGAGTPGPTEGQESPADSAEAQSGGQEMGQETALARARDRLAIWDKGLAIGKEAITGCMGILIILATLATALIAIFMTGQSDTWTRAKDVLIILNGLVGVVLGYYFGRMPGEARADKAEGEAQATRSELDRTKTEVRSILESRVGALDRSGTEDGTVIQLRPDQRERLKKLLEP